MKKTFYVLLSIIISTLITKGQSNDSTNYFTDYSHYFTLNTYGIQKSGNLKLSDKNSNTELKYVPNNNVSFGLSGQYKWIGIGFAKNFFPNNNIDKYGESTSFNLGITLTPKKWLINFLLSVNQGLYLKNTPDIIENWDGDKYHYMDSLTVVSLNFSLLRALNNNFSYKAAYNFNQIQNKNAGSLLLGGFLSSYGLDTDESIIPEEVHDNFATADSIRAIGLTSFGISGGYTYTFVIKKKFFLNLYLVSHLGAQAVGVLGVNEIDLNPNSKIHLTTGYQVKISAGYNSYKWLAGLRFTANSYNVQGVSDADAGYNSNTFKFYLGRRFGSKKNPLKP